MICGNCGSESRKITVKWTPERQESCERCADGGLHQRPSWMDHKPVPLWESRPWLYKKRTGPDGETIYDPTDENTADLEAQVCKPSAEDEAAMAARRNRQVPVEAIDMNKANAVASDFLQHFKEVTEEYERANAEYWNTAAEDLKV